ncbi:MAG TPA: hypothetical protein DCM08_13260 [Microscillaceae bacterium]|nr:hypothetical protein [Microscillaceae bacterium]
MLAVVVFARCGGGGKDEVKSKDGAEASKTETKKAAECTPNQNLTFLVKGYKFGMKGDFAFDGKFEVKKAWFVPGKGTYTENGKTTPTEKVEVYLANYETADKNTPAKDEEMLIKFTLYAKGVKLEPQSYKKGTQGTYYASIDIETTKGKVYFNWLAGMPEEGNIVVTSFDGNKLCGEIKLKVDKPTDDKIGTVALNGTFYAEKK